MATRKTLSLAAALVALVALVAVASHAHAPAGGSGGTQHLNGQLIWEYVLIGLFGLCIIGLPITAWALWSSRGEGRPRKRRPKSYGRALFVLGILALTAVVAANRFSHDPARLPHPRSPLAGFTGTPKHAAKPTTPVPFDWLPAIVVLAVATGVALVVTMI